VLIHVAVPSSTARVAQIREYIVFVSHCSGRASASQGPLWRGSNIGANGILRAMMVTNEIEKLGNPGERLGQGVNTRPWFDHELQIHRIIA
jgi:hypothetical protein